jgi:hypothetical protein
MSIITKSFLAFAVAGVLVLGWITLTTPQPQQVPQDHKPLGALSSPDIASPYLAWGGVRTWNQRTDGMNAASTTNCSIQAPAATSSIRVAGARYTTSTTTASTVQVYKAATPSTATTLLFGANIAANAQATIISSSTPDSFVIAPNHWVNVIMSGGTGTYSPTGTCFVQFVEA